MLDRRHGAFGPLTDHGAERRVRDARPLGFDAPLGAALKACPNEHDPCVGLGGMKMNCNGEVGMNAAS